MSLRRLRSFVGVAASGSLHQAADRLNIAQSALSRQMRDLETELGVDLFIRSARGVKLSPSGKVLLAEMDRLLPQIEFAKLRTQRAARGQVGTLRVAFTATSAEMGFASSAFVDARRTMPDLDIQLRFIPSDHQVGALMRDEIDLGLLYRRPPYSPKLDYRDIWVDEYWLAVASSHPLAQRGAISMSDLRYEDLVLPSKTAHPTTQMEIITACLRAGFSPRILLEADSVTTTYNLVYNGIGVSFTNSSMARHPPMDGITYIPIADFNISLHLAVMWKKERHTPMIANFVDHLIRHRDRSQAASEPSTDRKAGPQT